MLPFRETIYIKDFETAYENLVFVADIGGTNANFGICALVDHKAILVYSLHIKSRNIEDFSDVVEEVYNHIVVMFNLHLKQGCFGVAGVVSENRDKAKPTNLDFLVNVHEIRKKVPLEDLVLINDFLAVGFGLEQIAPEDIKEIYSGDCKPYGQKAIIGAGTGLGKSILYFSEEEDLYIPLASEGGHADFPAQYPEELELIEYIRKELKIKSVSWEHILSGQGIQCIYRFLGSKKSYAASKHAESINNNELNPDQIFSLQEVDAQANDTVELFARFYGRCAKDMALNGLALNGLYIAGGIASKNLDMFERPVFMEEFLDNHKQGNLLKCIPIYVIADYNISLYGAALYIQLYC